MCYFSKSQKVNIVDSLKFQLCHSFMARFHSNFARKVRISCVSWQSTVYSCVDHGVDLQHCPSLFDTYHEFRLPILSYYIKGNPWLAHWLAEWLNDWVGCQTTDPILIICSMWTTFWAWKWLHVHWAIYRLESLLVRHFVLTKVGWMKHHSLYLGPWP